MDVGHIFKSGEPWVEGNPAWRPGMRISDILKPAGRGGCRVECTPSNLKTGEPGLSYIILVLENGWNVVTASKGALVIAFRKLREMAAAHRLALKFSGATAAALLKDLINIYREPS